jgi:thioredoxin-related protein
MGKGLKELQAASDGDDFGGLQIEDDYNHNKPFSGLKLDNSSEIEDLKKKLAAAESNVSFFCEQMEQMKKENDELREKVEAKPEPVKLNLSKGEEVKEKSIMQPSKVESDED